MLITKPHNKILKFSEHLGRYMISRPPLGTDLCKLAEQLHSVRKATYEKQFDLLDYYTDKTAGYKEGTEAWFTPSKALLQNEDAYACALLIAAKNILGPAFIVWEPDSIWVELEDRHKLTIPEKNRDKLLAALTLLEMPAFYWEVNTFQNTIAAFNNVHVNVDTIQEMPVTFITWAVIEAELILQEHQEWQPAFDYEPELYTAECLHRSGFVIAPKVLAFAQDQLDVRNKDGHEVDKSVLMNWVSNPSLSNVQYPNEATSIALNKLIEVDDYIKQRTTAAKESIDSLS